MLYPRMDVVSPISTSVSNVSELTMSAVMYWSKIHTIHRDDTPATLHRAEQEGFKQIYYV